MKDSKKAIVALLGVTVEAAVAMANDVTAPIQDVEIRKTIDHKNNPTSDKNWQGYMVHFGNTSAGVPKVVPISAGRLLAIQLEQGVQIFAQTEEGLVLTNTRMGIENGSPVFEAAK